MVQIIIFIRADPPQLYQSKGKGSEAGGLSSESHRCLFQDAGICFKLDPVWDPFDQIDALELCSYVLRSSAGSKNTH